MTMTLQGEARKRLDAHLDAVEAALVTAGKSREERRGIVDDLEAQILDMLATKGESPALQDVEAVLAQLDPPAAYASGEKRAVVPPPLPGGSSVPRYSRTSIAGLVCILVSLVPLVLLMVFGFFLSERASGGNATQVVSNTEFILSLDAKMFSKVVVEDCGSTFQLTGMCRSDAGRSRVITRIHASAMDGMGFDELMKKAVAAGTDFETKPSGVQWHAKGAVCLYLPLLVLALPGTVLGWIAFFQIRASRGNLRGRALALFDGLFYPVAGLLLLLFTA